MSEQLLIEAISDVILDIANQANDLTTSDLQGLSGAAAIRIIKLVREVSTKE